MRQSSNELPASLLLVGNSNEVIGHARISAVLGVADGVFIESGTHMIFIVMSTVSLMRPGFV
jgi:hypothetical protein